MAEETTKRILEVEVKDAQALGNLAAKVDEDREAIRGLDKASEEYQQGLVKLKADQEAYNSTLRIATKEAGAAKGSYNELNAQLMKLKKAWKETSDATERAALTQQINAVKGEMAKLDHSIGNWQANVGNYAASFQQAMTSMGMATNPLATGIKGVGAALKAMLANPVVAVAAAVVAVVMKVVNAVKKNEDAVNRLKVAFAPMQGILTVFRQAMDKVVGVVVTAVEWFGKAANAVANFFKIANKQREDATAIAEKEVALQKERRQVAEDNAKSQLNIAKWEAEAAKKGRNAAELLRKVEKEKNAIKERNKTLAQNELELEKLRAEQSANSTAENDKLTDATVKATEAETEYYRSMRRTNSQLEAAEKREKALNSAREEHGAAAKLPGYETDEEVAAAEAEEAASIAAETVRIKAEEERKGQVAKWATERMEAQEEAAKREADIVAKWEEEKTAKEKEEQEKRKENLQDAVQGIADIMGTVADIYEEDIKARLAAGEINERQAEEEFKNVKALQISQVWINTLAGMTAAISSVQKLGPAGWAVGAVQAASLLASGIAQTAKIRNTEIGSTSGATTSSYTASRAPAVVTQVQQVRTVTSASDEEAINTRNQQPIVVSVVDIENAAAHRAAKIAETSF